jgi:hypothetical protein
MPTKDENKEKDKGSSFNPLCRQHRGFWMQRRKKSILNLDTCAGMWYNKEDVVLREKEKARWTEGF